MASVASATASDKVWEFQIDGLEEISLEKGPLDNNQLLLTLSTANRVNNLVMMCRLNEAHPQFPQFGFGSGGNLPGNRVVLWGPLDATYAELLNVLKTCAIPDPDAKTYTITLI